MITAKHSRHILDARIVLELRELELMEVHERMRVAYQSAVDSRDVQLQSDFNNHLYEIALALELHYTEMCERAKQKIWSDRRQKYESHRRGLQRQLGEAQ